MDFNSFLYNLNSLGFYNFVLPWILFLMIFFVIIEQVPFLQASSKKKQIAIIIASVLSFFAVNTPVNGIPLGRLLSDMFGWTSVYLAGILVVLLFLGMGGYKFDDLFKSKMVMALIFVILAILVLGNAGFPMLQLDSTTWTLLFVIALVGGAVIFLGEEAPKADKPKE